MKPWTNGSYEASENLASGTEGNLHWRLECNGDTCEATINSETGKITFGANGEEMTVLANCPDCPMPADASFKFVNPKLDILWNGEPVTGTSIDIQVGEYLLLPAWVTPKIADVSSALWNIPEKRVGNYFYEKEKGEVIQLEQWELESWTIDFYFHDGGEKKVHFSCVAEGVPLTAWVIFNVKRPIANGVPIIAAPRASTEGPVLGKYTGTLTYAVFIIELISVKWEDGTDVDGDLCWVQVGKFQAWALPGAEGSNEPLIWDYPPTKIDGGFPTRPGGLGISFDDHPATIGFHPPVNDIYGNIAFATYLMYKSKKGGSIWVSLKKSVWSAQAAMSWNATTQQFEHGGAADSTKNPTFDNEPEFPVWTGFIPSPPPATSRPK